MENLKEIKEMLEKGFEKENRFFHIQFLQKSGRILKSEAGWLIVELGLNK